MNTNSIIRYFQRLYVKLHFTRTHRLGFYESLSVLLANMPLKPAVEAVREINVSVRPKALVNQVFKDIWESMQEGVAFADCLAPWVPDGEYLMFRATSEGGDLTEVLATVVLVQRRLNALVNKILGAMVMPTVYLVVLIGTAFVVSDYLVPFIQKILPSGGSGAQGDSGVGGLTNFMHHWLAPTIIGVLGLLAATVWSFSRLTGPVRNVLDRVPGYSIYRAFAGAEFLLTLSGYLKQNIPVHSALEKIKASSAGYREWHVDQMLASLRTGREVGEALRTGLFSKELEVRIMSYTRNMKGGDFSKMIEAAAEASVIEVSEKAIRFATAFSSLAKAFMLLALTWLAMVVMSSAFGSLAGTTGVH